MSGLSEFKNALSEFRSLSVFATAGSGALPLAGDYVDLSPPQPEGVSVFAALLMLVVMVLSFHFFRKAPKRIVNKVLFWSGSFLLFSVFAYMLMSLAFVKSPTNSDVRLIVGCGYTVEAQAILDAQLQGGESSCPGPGLDLVVQAEFDAFKVYDATSLIAVSFTLSLLWISLFCSFAILLVSFIVYQSRVK